MMKKPSWLFGAVAFLALVSGARAADMPLFPQQPEIEDAAPVQFEYGTGWYLRGDVGASYGDELKYSNDFLASFGTIQAPRYVTTNEWGYSVGGGAGYKFNNWLRFDVTGDYLGQQATRVQAPIVDGIFAIGKSTFDRADGLVNAYVDLGNYGGFTPYVGAGVGASATKVHGTVDLSVFGTISSVNLDYQLNSGYQYNVAWAAMAGVGFQIAPHMLLDVGYRYLDLGNYRVPLTDEKHEMTEQQVRVGIRYQID